MKVRITTLTKEVQQQKRFLILESIKLVGEFN
jgi:hypothetical protein